MTCEQQNQNVNVGPFFVAQRHMLCIIYIFHILVCRSLRMSILLPTTPTWSSRSPASGWISSCRWRPWRRRHSWRWRGSCHRYSSCTGPTPSGLSRSSWDTKGTARYSRTSRKSQHAYYYYSQCYLYLILQRLMIAAYPDAIMMGS